MTQKGRENFLRNAILIVDHAKDSVISLLDLDLRNKHLTFEQFLNQNQHEIYHLCYNSRCCQCPRGHTPPRGGSRVLYPSQLDILYDKSLKKNNHTHGRSPDFCCSLAKTGILTSILDLTLGRCLLVNFCTDVFWYSCLTVQSLTLENFLIQNKHILYHLWQNTSSCCQCQPNTSISSSQQILDQRQWTTLYTANVLPCALHRKRPNTGVQTSICAFGAKSGITVQILDPYVNKIILENCCGVQKAVELIVKRRNHVYGHANEARISDSDYLKFTNEIGNGLIEIARVCGNESEVRQQLLDLEKRTLDETLLIQYQIIMLDHVSRNEALNNKVEEIQRHLQTQNKHLRQTVGKAVTVTLPKVLKRSVTSIEDRLCLVEKSTKETNLVVKKIETQQAKNPKKSRFFDHTQKEIDQHLKEKTFVEIRAIRKFMTMHSDKDVFFITGNPGKGKSRNGLDILRQLGEKYPAYDVVKVSDLHTVDKILNEDSRTILLLEDVFGKTNCRYSEDTDRRFLDILQAYIDSGNVKVIFTVRSVIKKSLQYSPLFSSHRIFKGFEEINLNSSQFEMTIMEKERLFLNYCSKNNIKIVHVGKEENYTDGIILDKSVTVKINEATSSNIVNTEPYLGFPESCYMFTANRPLTQLGVTFFKHPTSFLNQEIDSLRRGGESNQKDRIRYITLVYILLSSNKLDKQSFDEHKTSSILKSCRYRDGFISKSELVDAADEMTGSYLTYNRETLVFQLQHQTIFESVMLSYYRLDPKSVLNMIDFEMLQEVVKLGNNNEREGEIKMIVPKNLYGDLAKRLFLIFRSQFRQTPSTFIKVLCDSDLMTHIDSDFILQLGKHFFEASNYNITTIITYEGKSEEVVFCFLAVILWYSTIKYWQSEDIKIILHSLKTTLQSETRSNVKYACKRTIIAAFLHSCDKNKTNGLIELFLQTINELEIGFDINRCFQDVVDRKNQLVASCILRHFSQKINIVEAIIETDREELPVLINIFTVSFFCSNVECSINDRASLIKWIFSSVNPKHFNMTEAVQTSGNKGLMEIVDWFFTTFKYKLFDCQVLMKEACSKGWEIIVRRFLQEDAHDQPFDFNSIMSAACQYSWHTILKQLLKKSTSETFDVTVFMTEACRKFDFENVKSLIIYIGEKDINLNNTMNDVFGALKASQPWSLSEFCTSFIKVLLKHIDSDEKENLESLNTINLLLDGISELTFNIRFALVDVISNDVIHKQRVLQLFIDNNHIKQIKVSLLLLDACRLMNNEFVTWLLKNIDNDSLKVTTSFNESCTYGRLQIIKIMIQHSDHKLLNFSSAFLCSVKEEWRQHNEQNEEVMKFLLNAIDHSLFDFNTIAKEIILLEQEDVMKILLNNVDIRSFGTEQVVDYACEQGLLEILEIFWKSEKKEQKDIFSVVSRALKGSKLDIVNWFRAFNKACKAGGLQLVIWILDQSASLDIVKCILDREDHNLIDWKLLDMKTVMNVACKLENLDIVECILEKEDHKLLDINSAMNEACREWSPDIVQCILDKVDHTLLDMKSAMTRACKAGNTDIVKCILDKVYHTLLDMKSAMTRACKAGNTDIVKCILDKVDHTLLDMKSAMTRACKAGNTDIVKCFLDKVDHTLLDMKSAMIKACEVENVETVKYLLDKVDHNLIDFKGVLYEAYDYYHSFDEIESSLRVFKVIVENVDWKRLDMNTVMNIACKLESLDIVKSILDKVDHTLLNLNSAMIEGCRSRNTDIVRYLLDNVDHNLLDFKEVLNEIYDECCEDDENEQSLNVFKVIVENVDWKRLDVKTVMKAACTLQSLDVVKCILEKEDHKLLDINSAMNEACREWSPDIVQCILDKVDHTLLDMKSAMTRACKAGNTDIVKCILDKVDHTLLDMKSAMTRACKAGNTDIVKCILDKVYHTLLDMKSAMTRACKAGNTDIVKCILDKVDHTLLDMKSAMIKACEVENVETVKYLLDKVDHNLIDFKGVLYEAYDYYHSFDEIESSLRVFKVIVENVDWKRLDMNTVMNIACKLESLDIVMCTLNKVDHTLLDMNSAMNGACEAGNVDTVKCILDNVDHNLFDFKEVLNEIYDEYCQKGENEQSLSVFKVIVENVDRKRLDMKTVMNVACKFESLDIVMCTLNKVDHTLLDMKRAMNEACRAKSSDIVECILVKMDHTLLDMNGAINEACEAGNIYIVKCILEKADHTHLDMKSAMIKACEVDNVETVKYLLDKVDHNLIDFKGVLYEAYHYYMYYPSFDDISLRVLKVIVEIVDWKRLDMNTVMNIACKLESLDIVKSILDKVDHTLLNLNSAMIEGCRSRNTDIVRYLLDNVDHNLLDFKEVLNVIYDECCEDDENEQSLNVFKVIVENVDWKLLDMKTVMNVACKLESLDIVECVLDKVDHTLLDMNSAVMRACEAGNTDIVKYILDHIDHEMLDINSVMTAAIKCHDLFIVKYLCNNVNKISLNMKVAFNETCRLGNHELVIWILENVDQSQLDIKTAMLKACRGPNDWTVKLLNQRFGENMFDIKSSMNNACRYGNIAVIRWLWSKTDKQHVCDMESALINACLSGKEGNVKWLVKNIDQSQFDIQASITKTFVNGINVTNVIKTLLNHSDRSLLNMNTIIVEACAIGNMTLVEWLLKTNDRNLVDINQALYSVLNIKSQITGNDNVYNKRITLEKRSLVMWVLKKYSLSLFDMNNTVKEICRNGWTDILQWIWGNSQDHSLEIGPALNLACVNDHKELVEWALSNIDANSLDTETLMNESCGNGLLTVAKWMWENIEHSKFDMRTAMSEACSYSRFEIVQWILENIDVNLLDTGNVFNEASKHGWLSVVKDLLKDAHLSQYDIRSIITEACMNGHLDIVEYMFTKFGKDICDIESILPGLCSNPVNKEVAKFLISQYKNQLRLFTIVMPHACAFGWTEVVEMLLQDTDHTGIVMRYSLLNACRQGEVDVVKIILSKIDHTQLDIAEAFIVVCTHGWEEITKFLLDEIDHTAFDMKSALTEASRSGEEDIVELLLQKVKPEKFDIQMAIDAASQNHMHENIVYQLLQRNCYAKFEQDRLKKKAEEHDWPKVLSIIRKNSERK